MVAGIPHVVNGRRGAPIQVASRIVPVSPAVSEGKVEDGRGSLGHAATLRFPSPLIKPDVPISGIRLSDWLHRKAHGRSTNRKRLLRGVSLLRLYDTAFSDGPGS